MKITLQGNHLDLTEEIKKEVDKKLAGLDKFLGEGTHVEFHIELSRTTNHHRKGEVFRAEANIVVPGTLLRVESEAETLFQAIDELKDEMQRELKKYKEIHQEKERSGARQFKEMTHSSELIREE